MKEQDVETPLAERDRASVSRSGVPAIDGEVEQIEAALDVLLRDIIAERSRRASAPAVPLSTDDRLPPLTLAAWRAREISPVDDLIRDPVNGPRLVAVEALGKRLGEIVSTFRNLQDVAERIAGRDPGNLGRRLSILNARWDGVRTGDGGIWMA